MCVQFSCVSVYLAECPLCSSRKRPLAARSSYGPSSSDSWDKRPHSESEEVLTFHHTNFGFIPNWLVFKWMHDSKTLSWSATGLLFHTYCQERTHQQQLNAMLTWLVLWRARMRHQSFGAHFCLCVFILSVLWGSCWSFLAWKCLMFLVDAGHHFKWIQRKPNKKQQVEGKLNCPANMQLIFSVHIKYEKPDCKTSDEQPRHSDSCSWLLLLKFHISEFGRCTHYAHLCCGVGSRRCWVGCRSVWEVWSYIWKEAGSLRRSSVCLEGIPCPCSPPLPDCQVENPYAGRIDTNNTTQMV